MRPFAGAKLWGNGTRRRSPRPFTSHISSSTSSFFELSPILATDQVLTVAIQKTTNQKIALRTGYAMASAKLPAGFSLVSRFHILLHPKLGCIWEPARGIKADRHAGPKDYQIPLFVETQSLQGVGKVLAKPLEKLVGS